MDLICTELTGLLAKECWKLLPSRGHAHVGSVAAYLGDQPAGEETVRSMLHAAPHRGATQEVVAIGSAVLGVANDPESIDAEIAVSDGWAGCLIGPLDNTAELITALDRRGSAIGGDASPALVVLTAFRTLGNGTWPRLRGDFAVLVTDGERLWAVRDQLGASTLFYRAEPDRVFMASEAKQVLAGAKVTRRPDLDALGQLFFGVGDADAEPPTALLGVDRVPRAHVLTFQSGTAPRHTRYWDPSEQVGTAKLKPSEMHKNLVVLLKQAVERALTGNDVVALSGGIDSPAIAAFAAPAHERMASRPLIALSTVYPDAPSVDETRYIGPIVEALDLDWHTYVPEFRQLTDLQTWVDRFDGPVPNVDTPAVAEFFVHVRQLGARTVLFGELAELTIDLETHVEGELLMRGHWIKAAQRLTAKHRRGVSWYGAARSVLPSLTPPSPAMWYVRRRGEDRASLPSWIDPAFVPGLERRWDLERPVRRRWSDLQAYFATGPSSIGIEATSICAAHHGVHMRRPLVDVDLWEFLLSLPAHLKYPGPLGKTIIRDALRGRIPDQVLDRSDKTGFNEDIRQRTNYPALRKWILGTDFQLKGIRYGVLEQRLQGEDLDLGELNALGYLASIHAFVDLLS